jgi:hypothetical protein
VFVFAKNRGLKQPWRNTKIVGKDWFTAFLKRNVDISLRTPEGLPKARAEGMNRKVIEALEKSLYRGEENAGKL